MSPTTHVAHESTSPLLHALDRAMVQALAEEAATHAERSPALPYEGERGRTRGGPAVGALPVPSPLAPPASTAGSPADLLLSQLGDAGATVSAQIASVQRWLSQHPDLLRLLDAGMRQQFQEMERRTNRKNILYNVAFTVLGALLGLVLPAMIATLPSILAHVGR